MKNEGTLEVSRVDRLVAIFVNNIAYFFFVGGLANLILFVTSGRTIGSIVMGFSTKNDDGSDVDFGAAVKYFFMALARGFAIVFTFGIFWIYDIATLEKRNGNFAEHWAGMTKKKN